MKKLLKTLAASAILGGMMFSARSADAGSTQQGLTVTATVGATCTLTTSTGLSFGEYSAVSGGVTSYPQLQSQVPIQVNCTGTSVPGIITIDSGLSPGGTGADTAELPNRNLLNASTGTYINYQLFVDSAFSLPWSRADAVTPANVTVGSASGLSAIVANWGAGASGPVTDGSAGNAIGFVSSTTSGTNQTVIVYGQVPTWASNLAYNNSVPPSGNYTDTVQVYVTF